MLQSPNSTSIASQLRIKTITYETARTLGLGSSSVFGNNGWSSEVRCWSTNIMLSAAFGIDPLVSMRLVPTDLAHWVVDACASHWSG